MNSIFLRIYGGMLVAMLLVAGLAWGVVHTVHKVREDAFNEQMLRGFFWSVANGAGRYQGSERERWLGVISKISGFEFALREESSLPLDSGERRRLQEGRVVLRITDPDKPAEVFMKLPAEPLYVTSHVARISEQQWRATVVLVLDELGQHPVAERDAALANVRAHYGFPVSRLARTAVRLDPDQLARLDKREVVITLSDTSSGDSGIRVFAPFGRSDEVLMLGPIAQLDPRPWSLLMPLGAMALVLMGLAAYLLVRPLEHRLKNLEQAVHRVAAGDLSVRAAVRSGDAVGQLAASFNGMTAHIQRLIQSQREMTRAVSHELRTPVARVRFGLEMLESIDDARERRSKITAIDRDIDELDDLIDEILTYARLEEGSPSLDWSPVDLAALAAQVQREQQPIAGAVAIRVEAPAEQFADGEERYLHRVLQNLVANAIRYARSEVVVRVLDAGDDAELVVDDDGPGIPEPDRVRVFEPFARLDDSRHRASGGYGLGLSIVQRIAEWHGGKVWVAQSPAGGASFHLRWPRRRAGAHVLSGRR